MKRLVWVMTQLPVNKPAIMAKTTFLNGPSRNWLEAQDQYVSQQHGRTTMSSNRTAALESVSSVSLISPIAPTGGGSRPKIRR